MKQRTPQKINKMKKRYYKKLYIKTEYVHENSGYQWLRTNKYMYCDC